MPRTLKGPRNLVPRPPPDAWCATIDKERLIPLSGPGSVPIGAVVP